LPSDFGSDTAAIIIEEAIRKAARGRDAKARRRLQEVEAAAQERRARLLSASPAVSGASHP